MTNAWDSPTAVLFDVAGICTFDDEYSGYSLDPNSWTAMDTATTGYTAGVECYTPELRWS